MVWLDSMRVKGPSKSHGSSVAFGFFGADDQPLGQGQHHKSDAKQQKTQCKEGVEVQAFRLAKFIGQDRRDRSARREQRCGHAVGVANHKSHGHGLAQSTAQAQHDAANHTGLGVRQHHFAHHFPCGATQTIGRFAQDGGREVV